jgi:hypothetical protein
VGHLDDDDIHRVVSVDALLFATDDLAEYATFDRNALVAFCGITGYGKGVLIEAQFHQTTGVLKNVCEFVTHDIS